MTRTYLITNEITDYTLETTSDNLEETIKEYKKEHYEFHKFIPEDNEINIKDITLED